MILVTGNKNYSPWSLGPWFLMTHLGIEFEEICLPLKTEAFDANIRDHSPTNKVPVLKDADRVIWDSMAIFEYLAEKYPQHDLWPRERNARAFSRSICAEMHSGFRSISHFLPMNCRARNRSVQLDSATLKEIARVQAIWHLCRSRWDDLGPWLMGQFSIADAVFLPMVIRFITYGIGISRIAQGWTEYILSTPACEAWLAAARDESHSILLYEKGMQPRRDSST